MTATTSAAVVVPVKAFTQAKVRLASALDPGERADLARHMAEIVLLAADPLPAVVVCDDEAVRAWAERSGARVVWCPGRGLNGAVADGVDALRDDGVARAIVAHADLPLATRLDWLAEFPGVSLVPDRRFDGSNVVAVPTDAGFRFSYGAGSFGRHRAEAARLDLPVRIVQDAHLGWDVDLPADLAYPGAPSWLDPAGGVDIADGDRDAPGGARSDGVAADGADQPDPIVAPTGAVAHRLS